MTDLHTPHKLADAIAIEGRKGGSAKQHTPTEQPDSAASIDLIKMLLALGEGEWEGGITDQDIYLNDTPLANPDGSRNFQNVKWEFRPGTVDQEYIQGIPAVDNEVSVGVELKDSPYVYTATNRELSALRVRLQWPSIYKFLDNGDQVGYRIEYAIDLAVGSGPYQEAHRGVLDDKATSTYSRTIRVDLPEYQDGGWRLRVRRLTAPANSNKIADTMRVAAVAEVIDAKLRYPNTALLFIQFDAATFSSTPQVSVMAKGRKVRVPSNYDPVARTYTGTWDGSFVFRYTTNPTWHWYDVVLNRRFGLGRRIDATMVNKWALYRISQYCDQMVPDGLGGTEPRFTCNIYLQSQAEAWTVLRDISAIFRGMTYWSGAEMVLDADMPSDVVYTFSPSNIEGEFDYVASPWRDRYSLTAVKWDNPENNFKTETKPVPNLRAQARYGVRQADISAIGCTSRSEAGRRGEWVNTTSYLETNTVTFQTGVEGRGIAPGKLIAIADPDLAGKPVGGRISSVQSRRQVTLDREPGDLVAGDLLRLNMPSGVAQVRTISQVAGAAVTVSAPFGEDPAPEAQWSVERQGLKTQTFRVLSVMDGDPPLRKITAIQHNASKFDAIDLGARIEVPPVTSIPAGRLAAPAAVRVAQNVFTAQGLAVTTMSVAWDRVDGAVKYEVQWRRDNGSWVPAGVVSTSGLDVESVYAGVYAARVRAISSMDIYSIWTESEPTGLQGKTDPPPELAFLRASTDKVFSIEVTWGFPEGTDVSDTSAVELLSGRAVDRDQATPLGSYAFPAVSAVLNSAASGVNVHFWARMVDRSGNVGPWTGPALGRATIDAAAVNEVVTQEFLDSAFGKEFFSDVALITADASVPGSVNARLKGVQDEVETQVGQVEQGLTDANRAIGAIQAQIDDIGDLADSQEYKSDRAYAAGKIVTRDNSFYQAKVDVPAGKTPPDTAYWRDAGDIIRQGDGLAARVTSTEQTVTQQGTTITANSGDIVQLKASIKDKADASALSALTTRVTNAEGVNTSQGTSITNLQNSVTDLGKNKADASALSALTTRVTTAEGSITSQGNSITSLQNAVKSNTDGLAATNQTVSGLSSTVTQQGTTLTSQGQAITSINSALGDAGGENLLFNPSFETAATGANSADGWGGFASAGTVTRSLVASELEPSGKAARVSFTSLTDSGYVNVCNSTQVSVGAGVRLFASIYAKVPTGCRLQIWCAYKDSAGNNLGNQATAFATGIGTFTRYTGDMGTTPANTVGIFVYFEIRALSSAAVSGSVDYDRAQLELGARATGWHDNGKTSIAAINAQATATSQLAGRVTSVEGTITSQASSITKLQSDLSNAGGENLLYNPSFDTVNATDATRADGWGVGPRNVTYTRSLVASALKPSGKAQRFDISAFTDTESTSYIDLGTESANRPAIAAGRIVTFSVYVRGTPGLQAQMFMQYRSEASGAVTKTDGAASVILTESWQRLVLTGTGAPDGSINFNPLLRIRRVAGAPASGYVEWDDAQAEASSVATGWRDNGQVLNSAQAATATALSTLATTVTNQGGSITTQAGQITSLQTSITGAVQQAFNIVPNPTLDPLYNQMGFTVVASTAAGVPAGCPFNWVIKTRARDNYPDINALPNVPVKAGDVWRFTALVACEAGSGTRPFQHYAARATIPKGTRVAYAASPPTQPTQTWTRVTWDHTVPAGMTFMGPFLQIETSGSETATWYITDWHCENITAAKAAQATADAAATATSALTTRVTNAEGTLTAQSGQISTLQSQISGVGSFAAAQNFEFLNTLRGFYLEQAASGATLTAYQQNATISGYANFRSPVFPDVNGAVNPIVRLRIRRRNTTRNPIRIYWANEDGGLAEARTATASIDLNNTGWQDVEFDLSGVASWATKAKNSSIRFDLLNSADTSAVVDVAYVAIGRRGAAASATALADTQATVTSQGSSITSLVTKTDTLQTTVNGQTSSIQQVSQVQTDTTNRLNASWQVKFATTGNNVRYVSGIGFSVDGNGSSSGNGQPNIQTTFAIAADRFIVVGPGIDGNGRAAFSVVNNQTYINDAFINKATIVNAIIGQQINSAQLTTYGQPIMTHDFNTGEILIRNINTNGRYFHMRQNGIYMVADGVVLVEMSLD